MAFDWAALAQAGGSLTGAILNHFDQQELTRLQNNNARDQLALGRQQLDFNKSVAERNFANQEMQFQYQKELNQLMMDREDNAIQRRVADLKQAGLSPLMAGDGAQAGQLLSGNAPQFDPSGINQAYGNLQSAKQDYAQRQLATAQFKLQSKLQIAQLSADLMGALQQYQKNKLDYQYQKGLNDYVAVHGYRNLNWQSELVNVLSKLVGNTNLSSVGDKLNNSITAGKNEFANVVHDFQNLISVPKESKDSTLNFMQYGSVKKESKYGHMLDNENYDNDRPTWKMLKEEAAEKYYKSQLKNNNDDVIAGKLYDTDDYLKKHMSKDEWLKTSWDFRKNYIKYGYFK